jgi:hypothetical protein
MLRVRASVFVSSLTFVVHLLEIFHISVEPLKALVPEAAVVAESGVDAGQAPGVQSHRAKLCFPASGDRARPIQDLEVLGDCRLRQVEGIDQLAHGGIPSRHASAWAVIERVWPAHQRLPAED